jgi:transposase InsO family protein
MPVPCKADTHFISGSANDSTLLAFRCMGVGYLGTFSQGRRRVLVPICCHRQVHQVAGSYPVVNITKASAIAFLKSIVCRFEIPNGIITDNGTLFKSRHFQEYCEDISIQLCFTSVAHPRSNGQVEQANAEILRGSRFAPTTILKSMVRNGSTSFRAYYGGIGPHPTEQLGRPLSSWSMGPKHAFPRRSLWAHYESKLLMRNCRSSSAVKM